MAKSAKNREVRLKKTIKKGYRHSPNLDNLKSNTMKNTPQKYEINLFVMSKESKIFILKVRFNIF